MFRQVWKQESVTAAVAEGETLDPESQGLDVEELQLGQRMRGKE
jgi:hypothetical protein